jgi:hypothetical protein
MRFRLSQPEALTDQEHLVATFARQLRLEPASDDEPTDERERHTLPQTLLYGLPAAAAYLGLTTDQLRVWLEYGGPLATVARVQGRSVEAVTDIFVEHAMSGLGLLVDAGWLPTTQESALLTELSQRLSATTWEATRARDAA